MTCSHTLSISELNLRQRYLAANNRWMCRTGAGCSAESQVLPQTGVDGPEPPGGLPGPVVCMSCGPAVAGASSRLAGVCWRPGCSRRRRSSRENQSFLRRRRLVTGKHAARPRSEPGDFLCVLRGRRAGAAVNATRNIAAQHGVTVCGDHCPARPVKRESQHQRPADACSWNPGSSGPPGCQRTLALRVHGWPRRPGLVSVVSKRWATTRCKAIAVLGLSPSWHKCLATRPRVCLARCVVPGTRT